MSPSRRSPGSPAREVDALQTRLATLRDVAELGEHCLDEEVLARIHRTTMLADERLGHGTSHTVVALAGATGSGKSSLFNAITGTDWATTGIRRPTTSAPMGAVFADGADDLLDWLQVPDRQRLAADDLSGLVLLDLPDHDSTVSAHRAEVDRLVAVVDVFAWVVDPQKYADAALHEGYLRRFAGHGAVTMVLLNQVDRLTTEARRGTVADLHRLLVEDGLRDVRVLPVSATTGEGIDAVRRELAARVAERRAIVTRLDADVDWLSSDLASSAQGLANRSVSPRARRDVIDAAAEATGAGQVESAVAGSYRHRGSRAAGWPLLRWTRRLRPDPLSRLGLSGPRPPGHTADPQREADPTRVVRRTAIAANPLATARLDESLRHLTHEVGADLPRTCRRQVESVVVHARDDLPDDLDRAASRTDLHLDPPAWWRALGGVQWLASAALLVGLGWLLLLWGIDLVALPEPPTPAIGAVPVPTVLALGGLLVGLLLSLLARWATAVGARRRGKLARASLTEQVAGVVDQQVVEPVNAQLGTLTRLSEAIAAL
jgi:GTP-binding protein EngB required for normal cell division